MDLDEGVDVDMVLMVPISACMVVIQSQVEALKGRFEAAFGVTLEDL